MTAPLRAIPPGAVQRKLRARNPHWRGAAVPLADGLRERHALHVFLPLVRGAPAGRALVLLGPRRVGKTVLLMQTLRALIAQGEPPGGLTYVPLDDPLLLGQPLEALLKLARTAAPETDADTEHPAGSVVVFDEVQYLDDWEAQLKALAEAHPRTRFIACASVAPTLGRGSGTAGAEAFTEFQLPPLTFYEFLRFQDVLEAVTRPSPAGVPIPTDLARLNGHFLDYLNYGGYPESAADPTLREHPERQARGGLVERVLLNDLPALYGIGDIRELSRLFTLLAHHTAQEVSYEALTLATGIAKNTLRRYVDYLEAAFLVKTVRRIDRSARTFRRANFFKVYLTTPSLHTALFGPVALEDDIAHLVETALFSQFLHHSESVSNIHYVRWKKAGAVGEVDFVQWDRLFRPFLCIDVKWDDPGIEHVPAWKGLLHFARTHRPGAIFVTTRTTQGRTTVAGNVRIALVPASVIALGTGFSTALAPGLRALLGDPEPPRLPA